MKKYVILFLFIVIVQNYASCKENISLRANIEWFKNFNDEYLINYIITALENNKNLRETKKNILKYRNEKNMKIADEFPNVNIGANYLLLKVPNLAIPDNDIQTNSFALPFMTFWELDYLGKNYNKIEKARLDTEKSAQELKSNQLIVMTDTAHSYLNISNLNSKIFLQEKINENCKKIYLLKKKMEEEGLLSKDEIYSIEDDLLKEEITLRNFYLEREIYLSELKYLTGKSPYDDSKIIIEDFKNIDFTGEIPKNLKGDIIFNRPDIIKAELELKKAKLDITISKKEFFPSINIFGFLTFSTILQKFDWQTAIAALSVGAMQNIFDGGKKIFKFKKLKAEYEAKLEKFFDTDLHALKEINDGLYTLKKDYKNHTTNISRQKLKEEKQKLAEESYKKGLYSLIDALEYEKETLKTTQNTNDSKNKNFTNLLFLYKATGGAL